MKLDIYDKLASSILHWAKENGYKYSNGYYFKDDKCFSICELYEQFKSSING